MEFIVVWFESTQEWIALLDNHKILSDSYGAVGYAVNAALTELGAAEADFDCDENYGNFMRYIRTEETE